MADTPPVSLGQKIFRNSSAVIVGDLLNQVVNFFTAILIARSLGETHYGEWSFIYVYLSFFEMFIKFGLDSILTRQMAVEREHAGLILGNAVLLRFSFVLLSLPIIFLTAAIFHYPASTRFGLSLASLQLFFGIRALFETVFRVELAMGQVVLWNTLKAVLNLSFVGTVFLTSPSVPLYITAAFFSGFITMWGIILQALKRVKVEWKPDFALMGSLIKEAAPLLMAGYLTLLYYRIDVFMLAKMDGFESVGKYSAATKICEALTVIATGLMASLFPVISQAWKQNRDEFERLVGRAFEILLAVGLPLALGGLVVSHDLIRVLFGPQFEGSGTTLMILLWFTCVGFVSIVLVNILIACGKQMLDTWISLVLVAANIVMNAVLIPRFSYNGSAFATVLVEVLGTLLMAFYLRQTGILKWRPVFKRVSPVLLANGCFAGGLVLMKVLHFNWTVVIMAGVVLYAALIFAFRIFTLADVWYYLQHGFSRKK